ncbi:unnamed protein product [Lymnaea stagnalis]|uniref:Leucine-rich repeat-containing protein 71 n=1 Tax=Lymnaea stagnalis TaxID=6523 RepID=A0AAV2HB53_LYMST
MESMWKNMNAVQKVRMGKKVEKAFSKDRHLSSASHVNEDSNSKTPVEPEIVEPWQPHKCLGNFQLDFTELCKQNAMAVIPNIVTRPKVPTGQSSAVDLKPTKKEDKRLTLLQVHEPDPDPELNQDGEPIDVPPKTFTTRPKFEYFKPAVQVELDNNDKWDTVTEVFVRGWKIDSAMMEIFRQCLTTLERLHSINLWNTGLTEETVHTLATFLPQCVNLRNVTLDGNTVKEENWSELIGEESLIQNLSLRHCKITDKGAASIGRALGTAKLANTKLLSLNLTGNFIGDVGATALAQGLRMNRTLVSLVLMNNNIGNKGAEKLAEALSRFPLTHEETVERRKLMSEKNSLEGKSPTPSRRAESKDRPGSVRSNTTQDKTKQKPSAKKKDTKRDSKEESKTVKKDKEETKDGRGSKSKANQNAASGRMSSATATEVAKAVNKTKDKKNTKGRATVTENENADASDLLNPLMSETADFMDGQLWIPGNRILVSLNLSRNTIGEEGVASLLKAIQYQTTLSADDHRQGGTGLMRLLLLKNSVPSNSESLRKLTEMMLQKDPWYKHSTSSDIER